MAMRYEEELELDALLTFIAEYQHKLMAGKGRRLNLAINDFLGWEISKDDYKLVFLRSGYYQIHGMMLMYSAGKLIWMYQWMGRIEKDKHELSRNAYATLNKILVIDSSNLSTFRGPETVKLGKWSYDYEQEGDLAVFEGREELKYDGERVYSAKVIGGWVEKKVVGN